MAHGINEHDKGYVSGVESTWHGLEQYTCIPDRSITILEALEVANYPMEKQQLALPSGVHVDAWAIVRTDTDTVLVPSVGDRFNVIQNDYMVNFVNEHLLGMYPELKIQSVGTLFNGATFFLNIAIDEFQVKGDKSPTETNLMYSNPLGRGAYVACAHNTRIVCNNTERVARAQGMANNSLKRFSHTKSATTKINDCLIDIAELHLHLKAHKDTLDHLSDQAMSTNEVDAFLDIMFPQPEKEGRAKTIAVNTKTAILDIFEGVQTETLSTPFTKYGLYNAYTDWTDHVQRSRNADVASIAYDGIMGNRADKKQVFLDRLLVA